MHVKSGTQKRGPPHGGQPCRNPGSMKGSSSCSHHHQHRTLKPVQFLLGAGCTTALLLPYQHVAAVALDESRTRDQKYGLVMACGMRNIAPSDEWILHC
eukprot:scaffold431_cov334-Pavlova_lutheri.AAC.11